MQPDKFCICWGQPLEHIQQRKFFMERKAAAIIADISVTSGLQFLHFKADLKPENSHFKLHVLLCKKICINSKNS